PPMSTLFPYTPLFRSFEVFPGGTTNGGVAADGVRTNDAGIARLILFPSAAVIGTVAPPAGSGLPAASFDAGAVLADKQITVTLRSEEHTSELQSRFDL